MSLLNIGLQGQSGTSAGGSLSSGGSISSSQGSSWDNSFADSYSSGWGYETGSSHSAQQSSSEWGGYANGESYNQTFGREASAQDIINAQKANDTEMQMWAMQAAYNAAEAERSRDFQAYMSNTAYQRAVQDLKAAGLNPILAAGAAATTPVGATASSGLSSAHKANAFAESIGYSKNNSREWGSSQSSGYSSSSHYGENSSSSKSHSESHGGSQNSSSSKSQNSARSWENSQYSNNVKNIAESAFDALKNFSNNNAITDWVKDVYKRAGKY